MIKIIIRKNSNKDNYHVIYCLEFWDFILLTFVEYFPSTYAIALALGASKAHVLLRNRTVIAIKRINALPILQRRQLNGRQCSKIITTLQCNFFKSWNSWFSGFMHFYPSAVRNLQIPGYNLHCRCAIKFCICIFERICRTYVERKHMYSYVIALWLQTEESMRCLFWNGGNVR